MLNNSSGNAIASRAADDRQGGARALGQLNGSRVFRGAVGTGDKADFYSFTLSGRSSFNLALNKLKNNVDVALIQNGQTLARSARGGKKAEAIASTLEAGTYFIKVSQKSGSSKYRLALNASPLSANPPGTNPPGTNPPTSGSRFLSYNYGIGKFDPVVGKLSIVYKLDLNSTDTFTDITALGTNVYATSETNLYKVDFNTGTPTLVGNLSGYKVYGLGVTPSGDLYGVGNEPSGSLGFFSIDRNTGTTTTVYSSGSTPTLAGVRDIVYDPTSGRFIGGGYSISLAGDVQTFPLGATYDGLVSDSGKLYGYNFGRYQEEISPTTGRIPGTSRLLDLEPKIPETFGSLTGAG
jgi:Bacterial pre-peptidase C-terminal domain